MSDAQKRAAAMAALDYVEDGMRVGLGTGSTAAHFVRGLGERVAGGLRVVCAATSEATAALAREVGIEVRDPNVVRRFDLTVDGADELDARLRLIKGGGGALLREKMIAAASDRMIVIADAGKVVGTLGAFALPVEVVAFGWELTQDRVKAALADAGQGAAPIRRRLAADGPVYMTDNGGFILDCALGAIADPQMLASGLASAPGVIEHGLFIGLCDLALVGTDTGVRVLSRD